MLRSVPLPLAEAFLSADGDMLVAARDTGVIRSFELTVNWRVDVICNAKLNNSGLTVKTCRVPHCRTLSVAPPPRCCREGC